MDERNLYEILGVGPNASQKVIEEAYTEIEEAFQNHKINDQNYKTANQAWTVLRDKRKRRKYDRTLGCKLSNQDPEIARQINRNNFLRTFYFIERNHAILFTAVIVPLIVLSVRCHSTSDKTDTTDQKELLNSTYSDQAPKQTTCVTYDPTCDTHTAITKPQTASKIHDR